jgi:hypothetical protein
MNTAGTPMRWPAAWTDPSTLALLKGTAIDTLLIDHSDEFDAVRQRAPQEGFRVVHPDAPPDGVAIIRGEWPGVKMSRRGADADAGPTGVPWVNSNGWQVRLAKAMHPGTAVWIAAEAPKDGFRRTAGAYLLAAADAAAYGGRWIVTLEEALAEDLSAGKAEAAATWKMVADACGFFAGRAEWDAYEPVATVAVVSDFTGKNEFFSHELLNLLARAGLHAAACSKDRVDDIRGVRAVIYPDAQAPSEELRRRVMAFVAGGGLLITGPGWQAKPPAPQKGVAVVRMNDPYEVAQDAALQISHRYDLVRCWNVGAFGSYVAKASDGKRVAAHLLFYADRGPNEASVRVAGRYRDAKAFQVGGPVKVEMVQQGDAVELHLPQVSQYVALELTL